MDKKLKIVVACGGTGGHAFPGIAVAKKLKDLGHEVIVWNSGRDVESSVMKLWDGQSFPTYARQLSLKNIIPLIRSILRCRREMLKLKPDVLLAMGSYSSLPPVLAARYCRIPIVLHEANTVPGRAVEFLAKFAEVVAISFEKTSRFLPNVKTVFTGFPVREGIGDGKRFDFIPSSSFVVFVTGGSQGAHAVNMLLADALMMFNEELQSRGEKAERKLYVIHQTGLQDRGYVMSSYASKAIPARVHDFETEMASAFKSADIVVARAGASTCFELAAAGRPAFFIPLPTSMRNHQHFNADCFASVGAADEGIQEKLSPRQICRYLINVYDHPEKLKAMGEKMAGLSTVDAAEKVARLVEKAASKFKLAMLLLLMSASALAEVIVPYGKSPLQIGSLTYPKDITASTPKILLIHGGGWRSPKYDRSTLKDEAKLFNDAGFVVYNIDYRLAPENPWPACGDDCIKAAKKFITCEGMSDISVLAGNPIFVLGASAGGHLAMMTGLRLKKDKVLGVMSVSGIGDPTPDLAMHNDRYRDLFAGGDLNAEAFPKAHLSVDAPKILFTHCWNDTAVPIESAIKLAREMTYRGLAAETYFYDFDRVNEGHAIWDLKNKQKHVFYRDIHERCMKFMRGIRGLPEPLPGGASFEFLGKMKNLKSSEITESGVSIGFECLDRDMFDPKMCYDKLSSIGVKNARVQTGWWKCEKEKGVYDWTWLDNIVTNLQSRGIKVWFNVGFGNKLYMKDTYGEASVGHVPIHYGKECTTAWLNFCRELAKRYRDTIDYFEIWNESNNSSFWRPKEPDPEEFSRLLKITAKAIREGHPSAKCGGCVSGFPKPFLSSMVRPEVSPFSQLDFFALHPYDPLPELSWENKVNWLKSIFKGIGRGGKDIEIWQGESGFASWTPKKYWQMRIVRESERAQAVWLLRRFVLDFSMDLPMSSYFQMADMMEKGYQMGSNEQGARVVARQGILNGLVYTPKPAFYALGNVCAVFRDGLRPIKEKCFAAHYDGVREQSRSLSFLKNVQVSTLTFSRGREPYYFYYMPVDPQHFWEDKNAITTLEIFKRPGLKEVKKPVLVNMLSGDVYAITPRRKGDKVYLDNLPLSDTPMLICDRSALNLTK